MLILLLGLCPVAMWAVLPKFGSPRPPLRASFRLKHMYVGVLISLWLFVYPIFLFAAQPKEFFLDGLKNLEKRSHKCVELRGEYVE
jgi:hypothetical protein